MSKIIKVETKKWTEEQLRRVKNNPTLSTDFSLSAHISDGRPPLHFPTGCTVFFASTQPKKFYEIEQSRRYTNAHFKLGDAIDVLHWFHSADETSRTYLGNAYEKAESILDRIYDDLGYDKVAKRLRELGHDPEKTVFAVNDTGYSFEVDYSGEPEFKDCLHEKGLGAWPGVELGPVMDAQGGIKGFYSALHNMKRRMEDQGQDVNMNGLDHNIYLFFTLAPKREDVVIHSYYSEVPITHRVKPQPQKPKDVLTSYHFSNALDATLSPEERNQSRAELGSEYVGIRSAQALGIRKFIEDARIPTSFSIPFQHAAETSAGAIIIATHHNTLPFDKVKRWLPDAIYRETDITPRLDSVNTIKNGAYQELTYAASAVVLGEHHRSVIENYENYFLDLFDLWCSLHVDKQLRVETFENTPFFVLNRDNPFEVNGLDSDDIDWNAPEVERAFVTFISQINPERDPWQAFILFNQFLHEKGFIKQEPRFLHTHLDPEDPKLVKKIKHAIDKVRGLDTNVPPYELESWGKDRKDLFEVSVLGSASTRVETYTSDAKELGHWLAQQGWHVRTGGGRYGIMGAVSQAALEAINQGFRAHISAIQMPRTIQFEGAVFKQKDIQDSSDKYLEIQDSFDTRMQSIFRSNVCVAMAPGIGTYQEIARWIRLKEAGYPPLQDKKMIIYNSPQPHGPNHIRLMDPFLALLPDSLIDRHLIIADTLDDVKTAIKMINHKWQPHFKTEYTRLSF